MLPLISSKYSVSFLNSDNHLYLDFVWYLWSFFMWLSFRYRKRLNKQVTCVLKWHGLFCKVGLKTKSSIFVECLQFDRVTISCESNILIKPSADNTLNNLALWGNNWHHRATTAIDIRLQHKLLNLSVQHLIAKFVKKQLTYEKSYVCVGLIGPGVWAS